MKLTIETKDYSNKQNFYNTIQSLKIMHEMAQKRLNAESLNEKNLKAICNFKNAIENSEIKLIKLYIDNLKINPNKVDL